MHVITVVLEYMIFVERRFLSVNKQTPQAVSGDFVAASSWAFFAAAASLFAAAASFFASSASCCALVATWYARKAAC